MMKAVGSGMERRQRAGYIFMASCRCCIPTAAHASGNPQYIEP
jgi:hypothetical protein